MTELKKDPFVWPVRVYFEDTDAGGVVYHSRYLNFFERARTEMLRAMGVSQTELRENHGYIWVVHEIDVKFHKAAKLDDELEATAQFTWTRGIRQGIHQEMRRLPGGELVCTADVVAVMLDAEKLKPVRVPHWIKNELEMD